MNGEVDLELHEALDTAALDVIARLIPPNLGASRKLERDEEFAAAAKREFGLELDL